MRLDAEMLLASVGQDLSESGRKCLARTEIRDLEVEDGGASAVLDDPDSELFGVWVGVVNGVLTAECDCADEALDDVCEHAVAVALKALESGFTFSSIPAYAEDDDPEPDTASR
ncbi:hypothetical protein [Amycolatopsis sp. CA-230715]|uniref:hypothetical protein n=1 Tax=Amycolatopsis sp. CA-230715 TaxID=2745196 RepID=UPI001C01C126|nr:hypothetical protein [Amycolatopsis sp. CA-230715]